MTNQALRRWRDVALFLLGAGGFIHEVLIAGTERPTILLGCLALLGVPVFLRKDEGAAAEQVARAARAGAAGTPPQNSKEGPAGAAGREGQ